jgi:crossover junction endodeoxyribonuclease RuvC
MLVLGIDPGIAIIGYGLIQTDNYNDYHPIDFGAITTQSNLPDSDRLVILFNALEDLLNQYEIQSSAVEKLFFQKNVKTALSVGQARGVTILALAQNKIPISEYTPNEIKQTICGYGNAGKQQIQRMVQTLLELPTPPQPDDAADALAVAICHIHHKSFDNFVEKN